MAFVAQTDRKASTHLFQLYRVLGSSTAAIFLSCDHSLYVFRKNVMLDFICMRPVEMPGASWKWQNIKGKTLAHSGTRTLNLEICSPILQILRYTGSEENGPI